MYADAALMLNSHNARIPEQQRAERVVEVQGLSQRSHALAANVVVAQTKRNQAPTCRHQAEEGR